MSRLDLAHETELKITENWMRYLASMEVSQIIQQKQYELRALQMDLLLEMGQIHLKQTEAKTLAISQDRLPIINKGLAAIEIYLLIIHCCARKQDFFKRLLDPATPDLEIQEETPYQAMLEKILVLEHIRVEHILKNHQTLVPFATEAWPWKAFRMFCFNKGDEGVLEGSRFQAPDA